MDKETRKELNLYRYFDLTAIREHLEKRESEGWRLESLRLLAVYHRSEPKKVRYSAELLDLSMTVGHELTEKAREYIDLCEQADWSFVANYGPLYIFRTEKEDAPEIVSDPEEKLQNTWQAQLSGIIILGLTLFGLLFFALLLMFLGDFPAIAATRYSSVLITVCLLLPVGFLLMYNLEFLFWYKKAKRAILDGLPIPYNDTRATKRAKRRDLTFLIAVATVPIGLALFNAMRGEFAMLRQALFGLFGIAVILTANFIIKKRKCSFSKALITTIVVAFSMIILFAGIEVFIGITEHQKAPSVGVTTDAWGNFVPSRNCIPVTFSDIVTGAGETVDRVSGESTILAGLYEYESENAYDRMELGMLSYSIYYSPHESLIRSYVRALEKNGDKNGDVRQGIEAAPWGAEEAYIVRIEKWGQTEYVIVYDQYVLVIHSLDIKSEDGDLDNVAEVFSGLLGN